MTTTANTSSALDADIVDTMMLRRKTNAQIAGGAATTILILSAFVLITGISMWTALAGCLTALGLSMWSYGEYLTLASMAKRRLEAKVD